LKKLFLKEILKFSPGKTKYYPVKQKPLPSLAFCILMDLIGYSSFAVPFFGEFFDLIWAPISAIIYWRTFGGIKGFLGGGFNFLEELLPGTDIIPTFTISWFMQYSRRKKENYSVRPSTRW
jgi:hypothetical protein